jgi:glycosyltransferase involved in cell wall biosynthesis
MTITCIIPAFNEAARIAAVLAAVNDHPMIDQIIVVDDGSWDATSEVVRGIAGVHLITLPQNIGKTAALAVAIGQASGDHLLLVDADLIGLTPSDLTALIEPVQSGRVGVSISLRRNAPLIWRWIGLDYISGERVLPRALMAPHLDALAQLPKFGFEVFLNGLITSAHLRIAVVDWPRVDSPLKSRKYGIWTGIKGDFGMFRDLLQSVSAKGLLRQITQMRRLRL